MNEAMIPVLAFRIPYFALMRADKLVLKDAEGNKLWVKTRNSPFTYRGPVFLCNSKQHDQVVREAYKKSELYPQLQAAQAGIVGVGLLVDVRELSDKERFELFVGFNNLEPAAPPKKALMQEALGKRQTNTPRIIACPWGYFFSEVEWFPNPFPAPRLYGPIGRMSVPDGIRLPGRQSLELYS